MNDTPHNFVAVNERFGLVFRESLKRTYGRLPSASFVAAQFNLRSHSASAVSQESARRWIRGSSIPDPQRLSVLSSWLDIDYNSIFNARLRHDPGLNQDLVFKLLVSLVSHLGENKEIPSHIKHHS